MRRGVAALLASGAVLLAASLSLQGCQSCSGILSTFTIVVVDVHGDVVRDAKVVYRGDSGPVTEARCEDSSEEPGNCSEWLADEPGPGANHVHATSADGKLTADGTVTMVDDCRQEYDKDLLRLVLR